jgi:hypothetical protein
MMLLQLKNSFRAAAAAALVVCSAQFANAGTIIKLSLGDVTPDVEYSGGPGGVLSTVDDTNGGTTGEQDTAIDYVGDLSFLTDVLTATASYTLNGVTAAGPASVMGGSVFQLMAGGDFQLYDPANVLLLDVDLASSALTGVVGGSSGAEFSITDGVVVGGSLAPLLVADTVSFSIALGDINGGAGLGITPIGPPIIVPPLPPLIPATIDPFTADADKLIGADVIPEPATAMLLVLGGLSAVTMIRRRIM